LGLKAPDFQKVGAGVLAARGQTPFRGISDNVSLIVADALDAIDHAIAVS